MFVFAYWIFARYILNADKCSTENRRMYHCRMLTFPRTSETKFELKYIVSYGAHILEFLTTPIAWKL
jgi:hypothetical protein